MKITFNITPQQVKGIRDYLIEVSHDVNPIITNKDIADEVRFILDLSLQAGAIGDHILKYEK